jgi:hypothetical protein
LSIIIITLSIIIKNSAKPLSILKTIVEKIPMIKIIIIIIIIIIVITNTTSTATTTATATSSRTTTAAT